MHATHLTDDDIRLLGESRTNVCFCPTTERDLADGIGPARRLHDAGATLTLGSDSHAVIDLFEEMRAVEMHERLASQQRGHWSAIELLAAATYDGHRSLGFDDAGRIAAGQRADLVTVDLDSIRTRGTGATPETVVFAATAADVGLDRAGASQHDWTDQPAAHRDRRAGHQRPHPRRHPARAGRGRRGRARGPPGRLGRPAARRPRRPTPPATSAAARCCPASSTPTPTSSSPATGPTEFAARMAGESYAAGGIRTTVAATRAATDEQLAANVARLVAEMRRQGTTTVEIKSGYGLTVLDEARSLAVARQFTDETTFLGAHVVPPEYADDPAGYVDLVTGPMLDAAAPHASWIDVFCERGAFDDDQARAILLAGRAAGLEGRLHANQLGPGPGVRLACELGLTAVDHCTYLDDADVDALAESGTVATLLPGVEFSTRSPYPDARGLIDAGVTVALASDCNPGSCYTSSMPLCVALAVREMRMTPAEAVWSATAGGARALGRDDVGVLAPGKRAHLTVLEAPSYLHLAYRPGVPLVAEVIA